jgi:hypothetical protein
MRRFFFSMFERMNFMGTYMKVTHMNYTHLFGNRLLSWLNDKNSKKQPSEPSERSEPSETPEFVTDTTVIPIKMVMGKALVTQTMEVLCRDGAC